MKPKQHFDLAYVDMHLRAWTAQRSDFSLAVLIDEFSCLFYEACFYDNLWIKKQEFHLNEKGCSSFVDVFCGLH